MRNGGHVNRDNVPSDAVRERADEAVGGAVDPCRQLRLGPGADHAVEVRDDFSRFHEGGHALLDGGDGDGFRFGQVVPGGGQ